MAQARKSRRQSNNEVKAKAKVVEPIKKWMKLPAASSGYHRTKTFGAAGDLLQAALAAAHTVR